MEEDCNIGEQIKQKLKENGQSISWLAKQVNCDRSNFRKILNENNIHTKLLKRISQKLNYDFFACFSKNLMEEIKNFGE